MNFDANVCRPLYKNAPIGLVRRIGGLTKL